MNSTLQHTVSDAFIDGAHLDVARAEGQADGLVLLARKVACDFPSQKGHFVLGFFKTATLSHVTSRVVNSISVQSFQEINQFSLTCNS